ncbi:MAG: hypothetical protein ACI9D0_001393, partial [Bacteroidia bacterium]
MESFRDKLRRLRREDGAVDGGSAPDAPEAATNELVHEGQPEASFVDGAPVRLVPDGEAVSSISKHGDDPKVWSASGPGRSSVHQAGRATKRPRQGGMPVWLRHKLKARDGAAVQADSERSIVAPSKASPPSKPDLPQSKGMPRDLHTFENAKGTYAARIIRRPAADYHGTWRLQWACLATGERIAPLVQDTDLADFQGSDAVYLDIETTGLGGGVGTWPFMVALGHFDGDVFELWQGFLRDPGEEPALLHEVA